MGDDSFFVKIVTTHHPHVSLPSEFARFVLTGTLAGVTPPEEDHK
jgi:hypothetical protein